MERVQAEPSMVGRDLAREVTVREPEVHGDGDGPRIIALDTGIKRSIIRNFTSRGAVLELYPCTTPAQELLARDPDGFFLVPGPGDPAALDYLVQTIRELLSTKPVFGIFTDWRFSEHFHLGGAFLPLAGRGAKGITPVPTGDPTIDAQTTGGTMARNLSYIEFPVLLRWAPKRETGFRIGVGPSFGFITSANDRYEARTPSGARYVLERDIDDEVPGFDLGLSADVEWRFDMISIAARYTHGLTDLRQEGTPDAVHTRTLTGTGRIYLGRQKAKAPPAEAAPTE
jgi:hypothetical protein